MVRPPNDTESRSHTPALTAKKSRNGRLARQFVGGSNGLKHDRLRLRRDLLIDQFNLNPAFPEILNLIKVGADGRREDRDNAIREIELRLPKAIKDRVSGGKFQVLFDPRHRRWTPWAPIGWRSLECLFEHVNGNCLDRFRQCEQCGLWFYARTANQRCCEEKCRRKLQAQSPAFKERRRGYMRGLRALHKDRSFK